MLQGLSTAVTLLNKYQILTETLGEPIISNEIFGGEGGVPNLAYPGDRCCTFYEDTGYVGDQHTECMRDYESEHVYNPHDFGHTIESF